MVSYEFGTTTDGQIITAYILENKNDIRVEVLNYGCIIRELWVPKKDESFVNIVHGLDSVEAYEKDLCNFGAFIGRYANRIKDAEFKLNDNVYHLLKNDGNNYLHGTWNKKVFNAELLPARTLEEASRGIILKYNSPDGEDGFPGNVDVKVTYMLDDDNVIHMDYEAISDKDTVMNLTNHSYFNLGADQEISVNADEYLEIDSKIIPTGRILPVTQPEVMDLRKFANIDKQYPEMGFYDHCYILKHEHDQPDVRLKAASRGIELQVRTSEPAVHIYSGNNVGVAIETEMFPCAPNFPKFPSTLVRAGQFRRWTNDYRIIVY